MRLHALELAAVGPFATAQRIDFDALAGSGLFLLEGPTGAGKTTILDAITFALYGGLAGAESGADRLHSDFADPCLEPTVTAEFSVRGVRYLVTRVPEYQRPKRRGGGYTTQAMSVHLRRREAGRWVSVSSNKAEAGEAISTAIGLNREQFTQVMLLPQGEFAKFLRCDDDDRRKMLTKLFGTGLYDRVTAELDHRRGDALRQRQDADNVITTAVSAAAEAAGLEPAAREQLLSLTAAERAVRFKEISEELAGMSAAAATAVELARAQAAVAQAADYEAKQQAALVSRLTAILAGLRAHESTAAEHDRRSELLAAARRAEPVRPLLDLLAEAEARTLTARRGLLGLVPGLDEHMLAGQGELAGLAGLVPGSDEQLLAGQVPASRSRRPGELSGRVEQLLVGRGGPAAADRASSAEREAATLQHLVDAEAALPDLATALAGLRQEATVAAAAELALGAARDALADQVDGREAALAAARTAAADLAGLRERRIAAEVPAAAVTRLSVLEPLLAERESALRAAVESHQRLVDEYQRAMDARLSGMAAELAADLADGVACPVCGSPEHPAPASADAASVTAQAVQAARRFRDSAESSRGMAKREYDELVTEKTECSALMAGRSAASLAAESVALDDAVAAAEQAARTVARLEPGLARLRAEQLRLAEERLTAARAAALARDQAAAAETDLTARQAELGEAAGCYPSVSARQVALREAAVTDRDLAAVLDRVAAALANQARARASAETEALSRGFDTLAQARSAVLTPDRQLALDEQVTSWAMTFAALKSAAQAPDLAGLDPEQADDVRARALRVAADLATAQQAEQEARTASDALLARTDRLRLRLGEVQDAEDCAEDLAVATEPVIYLAGLAKGMAGQRRVALTTYVLRHWFDQVVAAANIRLSAMSAGRYELRRTDESGTRRERSGLMLSVIDRYTGEERSPRSLSGGETFYASLALALGLADVVMARAGGVELDTLFIDEGFGSLDEQTLDQVLGVIDDLRDHGRVIGIVSHVADLKDRMAERLEVRRLPDGSSTVKVVA
jgi:exonuclease SbcC